MRAEEALVQPAILERREAAAPGRQLTHRVWRLPRHDLHDPWMAEEVSLPECVGEMLLPGVLRVTRTQHRVDATGRQHRMGIAAVPFPDHQHLAPRLRRGDRRAQPGRAGADHENIADPAPGRRFRHLFGHATQEGGNLVLGRGWVRASCSAGRCSTSAAKSWRARLSTLVCVTVRTVAVRRLSPRAAISPK